jgi:uncharacterized protein DUF2442
MDVSNLAGRGVFAAWERDGVFDQVKLGHHGQLEWPGDLDLCPDALYLTLTGQRPEDIFTGPHHAPSDA